MQLRVQVTRQCCLLEQSMQCPGSFWHSFSRAPESQEKHELQVVGCAANPALAALLLGLLDFQFAQWVPLSGTRDQCGSLMMDHFPGMGQHKALGCLHKIHLICYLLSLEPYSEHSPLLLLIKGPNQSSGPKV